MLVVTALISRPSHASGAEAATPRARSQNKPQGTVTPAPTDLRANDQEALGLAAPGAAASVSALAGASGAAVRAALAADSSPKCDNARAARRRVSSSVPGLTLVAGAACAAAADSSRSCRHRPSGVAWRVSTQHDLPGRALAATSATPCTGRQWAMWAVEHCTLADSHTPGAVRQFLGAFTSARPPPREKRSSDDALRASRRCFLAGRAKRKAARPWPENIKAETSVVSPARSPASAAISGHDADVTVAARRSALKGSNRRTAMESNLATAFLAGGRGWAHGLVSTVLVDGGHLYVVVAGAGHSEAPRSAGAGDWPHGWQFHAARTLHHHFRERVLLLSPSDAPLPGGALCRRIAQCNPQR